MVNNAQEVMELQRLSGMDKFRKLTVKQMMNMQKLIDLLYAFQTKYNSVVPDKEGVAEFLVTHDVSVTDSDHAYWYNVVTYDHGERAVATCSNCKERGSTRTSRNSWGLWVLNSPRCPNCGAIMDGEHKYA